MIRSRETGERLGPQARTRIRWGWAGAAIALVLVLALAFVPDPLFRQRTATTVFDDVEAVEAGAPVYYRGAEIGAVRSVALRPDRRDFAVLLGIRRDWRPSACSFARIAAANPLTTPRIELVTLDAAPDVCATARRAQGCEPLPNAPGPNAITGCRRGADLIQSAAAAVTEAAEVAHSANQMAARLTGMMGGGGASRFDMAKLTTDTSATLAALSGISQRLEATLAPGRGDVALTLANVRQASDRAKAIDIARLNDTLREVQATVAENRQNVTGLLADAHQTSTATRALMENASASLAQTSANLARASDSVSVLSERLAADPTYALRGAKYADPPAPGSKP